MRLFPQHFNVSGAPKKRFKTEDEAINAAWINDMNYYLCDFCNNWHLTKKEK